MLFDRETLLDAASKAQDLWRRYDRMHSAGMSCRPSYRLRGSRRRQLRRHQARSARRSQRELALSTSTPSFSDGAATFGELVRAARRGHEHPVCVTLAHLMQLSSGRTSPFSRKCFWTSKHLVSMDIILTNALR